MYRWQKETETKEDEERSCVASLTSLRWAERFMMMMTTSRVDGAQFRLALLFSSWTAHTHIQPPANINNDGRLVWKKEKRIDVRLASHV